MNQTDLRRAEAVAAFPDLHRLWDLRAGGWMFRLISGADGTIQVKGMYLWRGGGPIWADMIQVRYVTDAVAVRLNPDRQVVWEHPGGLVDTVDAVLSLPPPTAPGAPRLVIPRPTTGLWTQICL